MGGTHRSQLRRLVATLTFASREQAALVLLQTDHLAGSPQLRDSRSTESMPPAKFPLAVAMSVSETYAHASHGSSQAATLTKLLKQYSNDGDLENVLDSAPFVAGA